MPTRSGARRTVSALAATAVLLAACAGGEASAPASAPSAPSSTPTTAPATTSTTTRPAPSTTSTTVAPCPEPPPPTSPPPAGLVAALAAVGVGGPGDEVSAVVHVEGYGEVLALDPDRALLPASTQKLLTAMAALEVLGADARFSTTVVHDAAVGADGAGTLPGDLVVVGGGDPTLAQGGLDALAAQVASTGLRVVQGDLVVDETRYGTEREAPGWQDFHVPAYAGPMSAFTVDDNRWRADEAYLADPATANAERFGDALARAGVVVTGGVRSGVAPVAAVSVATHASAPVGDLVGEMLRRSDNEVAEALAREAGRALGADGTSAGAGPALTAALTLACIDGPGTWGDGSGLSRGNRRSARELVDMLRTAGSAPWYADVVDGLPVAASTGTLARRFGGTPAAGVVRAKTGSILDGRALAGVATTAGGRAVTFAVLVNGPGAAAAVSAIDAMVVTAVADTS